MATSPGPSITWHPHEWPPSALDRTTAYLTHNGQVTLYGVEVRAYLFSDGQVLLNAEDLRDAAVMAELTERYAQKGAARRGDEKKPKTS